MKTYLLKYTVNFEHGFKDGEMRVKNCMSVLHAKIKLGDFLKRKYPKQTGIEIHSCNEDFMQQFGNIFGF